MSYIKELFKSKNLIQFSFMLIILMTTNFFVFMEWYKNYIKINTIKGQLIEQNFNNIKLIRNDLEKIQSAMQALIIEKEHLESENHEFDLKLASLNNRLKNTTDSQEVIRKEVQNNMESKISIIDFWRLMNNILIRIRWLENQHS